MQDTVCKTILHFAYEVQLQVTGFKEIQQPVFPAT
jgi:hypothetical protein